MDELPLRIRGSVEVNRQLNILIDHVQNVWHIDWDWAFEFQKLTVQVVILIAWSRAIIQSCFTWISSSHCFEYGLYEFEWAWNIQHDDHELISGIHCMSISRLTVTVMFEDMMLHWNARHLYTQANNSVNFPVNVKQKQHVVDGRTEKNNDVYVSTKRWPEKN